MKPLIPFLFLIISLPSFAQTTITHGYDGAGNRIVRSSSGAMMVVPPQTKNFWQTQIEENLISDKKKIASSSSQDKVQSATAVSDEQAQIKVYPNPTADFVFVSFGQQYSKNQEKQIVVYDAEGREVFRQIATGNSAKIDLKDFAAGVYVVSLQWEGYRKEVRVVRK